MLEKVNKWNPSLEGQKVVFENLTLKSPLLERIKEAQKKDDMVQKWLEKSQKEGTQDFKVGTEGVLRFRDRILVPGDEGIRREILEKMHRSKYTIHPEIKAEHQKPSGLLPPLEIPEWKWQHITMDFVTWLPRSQKGHDTVWVVVDWLTKTAHFLLMNMKYPLEKLAKLYMDEIVRLHGITLDLPASMSKIHNVFRISILKKYHPDPTHVIQLEDIEVDGSLLYEEHPVKVLDREVKDLRNKKISLVNFLWRNHDVEEATWETEEEMQKKYLELFI
ncbi:uncharacterized protein [Coffea arabica]|uniref:Uncharacterized protein n=1 Tax=Coffea arabica TaxID=13443 RepID=A0ABM4VBZ3_COFAR